MRQLGQLGRVMLASAAASFAVLVLWDADRPLGLYVFDHPSDIYANSEKAVVGCLYLFPFFFFAVAVYAAVSYAFRSTRKYDGETRCRKCGYILRGVSEPRCPECGERI